MTPGRARIDALACPCGGVVLHPRAACPGCGGRLSPTRIRAAATLVASTVVRVNPTGAPFRLGVAHAAGGASTLCVIEGEVRGHGRDRVRLERRDGRFHAIAARARVSERTPARSATRGASRKG
ncbi:MAG: hypothetical protein OEO21_10605 [Candidatus Krumholzibacteria bacterium]|nr:hypothetical protein [Candidatus Krumholzibacteria bacterium]